MAYNADTLLDRMRLKRQIRRWRIAFVIAIVVFIVASMSAFLDWSTTKTEYIARYKLEGFIAEDDKRDELMDKLAESDHVKGLILHIDSPGGTVVGGEMLFKQLRRISEKKPVVSVIHTLGTSGGYMAAIGTDRIYAYEGSITGSIGVLIQLMEVTELANKVGINPITIKSAPLKATPSPLEKMTPQVEDATRALVMDFFALFKRMVSERRNLEGAALDNVTDGRVFTGRQAVENKLIDAIGGEQEALAWLREAKALDEELPVRLIKEKKEPAEWLESFSASIFGWSENVLTQRTGLMALWHPTH